MCFEGVGGLELGLKFGDLDGDRSPFFRGLVGGDLYVPL